MDFNTILIAALITLAVGALFHALVYPHLSGDIRAEQRRTALSETSPAARRTGERQADVEKRRKQISESLKEIEKKGSSKKLSLETKLRQAGLEWKNVQYYAMSAALGVAVAGLAFVASGNVLYAVPGFAVGLFGLPAWILSFLRKRRIAKFIAAFPDAVDIIIRGIRAGLPLGDCLRIIAGEAGEPVRSEFRQIVEATQLGVPLGEAVEKLYDRVPVSESNFFSIVINIQAKSGGNLSEALGNLSRVLRERKKMAMKIQAMSSEAKASAGIIGALPFMVTLLLYMSSPRYIEMLWITSSGRTVLAVCAFVMFCGVMVMKKMINFDM